MNIIKSNQVKDRYWEIVKHSQGKGFYPLEIYHKRGVNQYFGGENYNFATPDLTQTFINKRIDYLTKADLSPVKKITNFGRDYRKRSGKKGT